MVTNNLTGLSTDTKPYAEEESLFYELDTGNWYYCTGGNAWTKVDGLSGVKVDNALIGKSTDGKPNASENTIFIETDTGKTYYRNGSTWGEIPSSGGGGGGGAFNVVPNTTPPREVVEAIKQGKSVVKFAPDDSYGEDYVEVYYTTFKKISIREAGHGLPEEIDLRLSDGGMMSADGIDSPLYMLES